MNTPTNYRRVAHLFKNYTFLSGMCDCLRKSIETKLQSSSRHHVRRPQQSAMEVRGTVVTPIHRPVVLTKTQITEAMSLYQRSEVIQQPFDESDEDAGHMYSTAEEMADEEHLAKVESDGEHQVDVCHVCHTGDYHSRALSALDLPKPRYFFVRGDDLVPRSANDLSATICDLHIRALKIEQVLLLRKRAQLQLAAVRPADRRWYEMTDNRFHEECHRNTVGLKFVPQLRKERHQMVEEMETLDEISEKLTLSLM